MTSQNIPNKILNWYDNNKRDLPWRRKVSRVQKEYFTLVSEFMLQQTQVKTVIPYFENFIKNFPSLKSLANANEQNVLKKWEGLGYYSRARNLKKTAIKLFKEFNVLIIVKSCNIEYHKSAKLEDNLTIFSKVISNTKTSFVMKQEIKRQSEIISEAEVRLVCVDQNSKPVQIPNIIQDLFKS